MMATDAGMLVAAVLSAAAVSTGRKSVLLWGAVFSIFFFATLVDVKYAPRPRLRSRYDIRGVVKAACLSAVGVISVRAAVGSNENLITESTFLALFSATYASGARLAAFLRCRYAGHLDKRCRPTLVVGAGKVGQLTAKRLLEHPEIGLRPVGFIDKEPLAGGDGPLPVLGASWDVDRVIKEHGVEEVVVTFSTAPHHVLLRVVRRCREQGVSVSVVPRLFEAEGNRVRVRHVGGLPLIGLVGSPTSGSKLLLKYAFDRVAAAILLVPLLPVLGALALAVRVSMGRPVLYRAERIGRDGHRFTFLKFRTMTGTPQERGEADADWATEMSCLAHPFQSLMRKELGEQDVESSGAGRDMQPWHVDYGGGARAGQRSGDGQPLGNGKPDPSIRPRAQDPRTRVGRFLRRYSLDELPQLWHVLTGEMSLIGPRPERVEYAKLFEPTVYRYGDRHRVKCGITGWAQVGGLRGETSLVERVEWDNYYIENWSFSLDLKILFMTIRALLRSPREV